MIVNNELGLHARPATIFVQLANSFESDINILFDNRSVNAKSIFKVLALGLKHGTEFILRADGIDEMEALTALDELFQSNFNE